MLLAFRSSAKIIGLLILAVTVPTKHSHGEIVQKNQQIIKINSGSPASYSSLQISWRVRDIVSDKQGQYVILSGHSFEGAFKGAIFDTFRQVGANRINTGTVTIIGVGRDSITAQISAQGTHDSLRLDPDYPKIMVGDEAIARQVNIAKTIHITPNRVLPFVQLFEDPYAMPNSLELTTKGKAYLDNAVAVFRQSKLPRLFVEGHTDSAGDAARNQVESYQRALTIRQYLVDSLKFDPERVVAIGLGETEPLKGQYLPKYKDRARRIVIKAKPY